MHAQARAFMRMPKLTQNTTQNPVRPLIQIGEEHDEVVSGFGALVMFVFFSFVLLVFVVMLNVTGSVEVEAKVVGWRRGECCVVLQPPPSHFH
jgi:hypothetical protein